ncbi:S-layer homology domain-containing protein [Rothia sp. ZJ932]|nr:S-layer homology domain-containing protein [Rothia sp. ZJ932]
MAYVGIQAYRGNEIAWLSATGISTGWPDRTFRAVSPVKRDAMGAFMYRLSNHGALRAY